MNSDSTQEARLRSTLSDWLEHPLGNPGVAPHQLQLSGNAASAALKDEPLSISAERADKPDNEAIEALAQRGDIRLDGDRVYAVIQR